MNMTSRGKRLARRYPILRDVPEDERPAVLRAALRHPLLLLPVIVVALVLLPPYFNEMFRLLEMDQERDMVFVLVKCAAVMLVPAAIAAPLLSRFVVPGFIRREMIRRGYIPASRK